jgi:3-phenylpropionate/cinnamic acid dioxygenase small subunit
MSEPAIRSDAAHSARHEVYVEIQQFLCREADILDDCEYDAWLALMTEDVTYRVTARVIREAGAPRVTYDLVNVDAAGLTRRVRQISNPKLTHAENPPSFTRRYITNLQAVSSAVAGEFGVTTNILIYRQRLESPAGVLYAGKRHDLLRQTAAGFRIAARHVVLDQAAFPGSVTVMF